VSQAVRDPLPGTAVAERPATDERWAIEDLVGPYGVVREPMRADTRGWMPPAVSMYIASSGNVARVRDEHSPSQRGTGGAGRALGDPARARRLAICEAAERYAMTHARPVTPILASGHELGRDALPIEEVARCSAAELRRPGCPIGQPDPDARIRWTEAVELTSREPRLVPLAMSHMFPPEPDENFWNPISTGCAIHRTQVRALLGGLYEVVERDSLSLTWLRRLRLPRLAPAAISAEITEIVAWYRDRHTIVHLFDATTDIPIPSIYCVMETPHDRRVSQVVGTASGFDLHETALKALLEASSVRAAIVDRATTPTRYTDFGDEVAGASFMARSSRRGIWSFLLDGERETSLPPARAFASPEEELSYLVGLFRQRGMRVYALDLTPREIEAIGYSVARVIIPALQPMSLVPLAQYRGHTRLKHDHPAATGPQRIRDLNPWPQPMA